jgi:hypothetical protein
MRSCRHIVAALLPLIFCLCTPTRAQEAVRVANLQNGETLRYPVALLSGEAHLPDGAALSLRNNSSHKANNRFTTSVLNGRFKALIELVPGDNSLVFQTPRGEQSFKLRYTPMTTPLVVRVIYVTPPDGDTAYPTQFEHDRQNYRAKLQTAARLIQAFTAETMNESGWGRKTFRLEEDAQGEVVVHVLRAPRPAAYYQGIDQGTIGGVIREFVNPQFPTDNARNLIINDTAGYDPATGQPLGHCANTNDGSAVFSALDIFSWPSELGEVQSAFSNASPVDRSRVFDDSNGRSRLWELAGTTVGVTLHELGHAFSLPHSEDSLGIMARGHDYFNRNFTLIEPPSAINEQPILFADDQKARFDSASAARLALHPFFQPDPRAPSNASPPSIEVDPSTGDFLVKAPAGLRALSVERDGLLRDTIVFREDALHRRFVERAELERRAGGPDFALVAMDSDGRGTFVSAPDLLDQRPFVRSWRLSPAVDWADTGKFLPVDAARRSELTAQLKASPAQMWFSPFVDLAGRLGAGGTEHKVAYAYRAIESDSERRVLLLTGSDDGLRVWVNGRLAVQSTVGRAAKMDEDQNWVTLQRGHNDVLVEVSNLAGGWGFYFRLTDKDNFWLSIAPDGSIERLNGFFNPKRFVRSYQLAPQTLLWPSADKFVEVSPERVSQLETELGALPVETSPSPFVDLRSHYETFQPVEARLAYARTVIRSQNAREVTLLTGSDDAIRVWLNGKLVVERLAARAAQPDDDRTSVTLRKGENNLLVEVSTLSGGWGFYLRFEQTNGAPLLVGDDGTLAAMGESQAR